MSVVYGMYISGISRNIKYLVPTYKTKTFDVVFFYLFQVKTRENFTEIDVYKCLKINAWKSLFLEKKFRIREETLALASLRKFLVSA